MGRRGGGGGGGGGGKGAWTGGRGRLYIYMGSSSVLVLIGSHSLCNSFVVNQFLFFHTKWRKFPLLYTQEAMRAIWWKKNVLFIFY